MSSSQEKINLLIEKAEINRDNARKQMRLVILLCILFPIFYLGIVSSIIKSKQTELAAIQTELAVKETELAVKETELAAKETELAAKKAELLATTSKLEEATIITEEKQATIEQATEVLNNSGLSNNPEFEQTLTALNETLGSERIKIRYVKSSEEDAIKIRDHLQKEIKNVEIEGVDEDTMRLYWSVEGYVIRHDKNDTEKKSAEKLESEIESLLERQVSLQESTIPSPNFISIFLGS